MSDLIDRQAAIDGICLEWCNRKHDDCVHISDFKLGLYWCDGCSDVQAIMDLPPVQPEIIMCEDCEHVRKWRSEESAKKFGQIYECARGVLACPKPEDFCSRAERREE